MSNHIDVKHKVKNIYTKTKFNEILEEPMLDDKEKQIMKMYYVENKDFGYIADIMGYSKSGILRKHKKILQKIESLL